MVVVVSGTTVVVVVVSGVLTTVVVVVGAGAVPWAVWPIEMTRAMVIAPMA